MAQVKISVSHLAKLANLNLSSQEEKLIGPQIEEVISSFSVLDRVSGLEKLPPTFQVSQNENILRPDEAKPSLARQKILGKNTFFTTKAVLTKK